MIHPEALRLAKGLEPTAGNITRIAGATSPDASRWAFAQWELRKRAASKFAEASEMLFDRDGLEMSSHEAVAAYHASLFPRNVLVADLTAGIGADTIALARRGSVHAFELEAERAEYLRHNLTIHSLAAAITVGSALASTWEFDYAYCDPSRRLEGRRLRVLGDFSPDPTVVAERFRSLRLGVIKLSPMLPDKDLEALGGSLEFISFGGECREALVHLGDVRAGRFAVQVESGSRLTAGADPYGIPAPLAYVYETDPAAIRAHCLGALCDDLDLRALADSNGYLTGDRLVGSPWLRSYEVLATHAGDKKRTGAELTRLGSGTPVIKTRGAQVDIDKLRKAWRGEGRELTVLIYPDGQSLRHTIARRLGDGRRTDVDMS